MVRRLTVPLLALLALAIACAPSAFADPINNPNVETFTGSCSNGQTYSFLVNQKPNLAPGLILGSNQVIEPRSVVVTATQVSTGSVVFSQTFTRGDASAPANGLSGQLVTCTVDLGTSVDPEAPQLGLLHQVITAVGAISPRVH